MANFDPTQVPRRAMKVTTAYPAKRAAETSEALPTHTRPQRGRWYMGCAVGMGIIAVFLFIMFRVIMPFYQDVTRHWTYGDTLVFHTRASLGRGAMSDIYTIPTQGSVVVLVVSSNKEETYLMRMQSTGNTLVIASVMDMNADGREDIVLYVDGSDVSIVLYNNGSGFQPTPPTGR